jgi:CHASE2 domain-containing sensor protein
MNKLLTTALFAALAALGVYMARRRIIFALKTGAITYVVLLFGRLLLSLLTGGAQSEPLGEFFWPVVIMLIAWVILTRVSTNYAERRERQKRIRPSSGAGRPAR